MNITRAIFNARMSDIQNVADGKSAWCWLASVASAELRRCNKHDEEYEGRVFVSLPASCKDHFGLIKTQFKTIGLIADSFIEPDSRDIMESALRKIRDADFFFALWHPDRDHPSNVSPWMPFEYGAARAIGKQRQMLLHADLLPEVRRRLEPSRGWIDYTDLTFKDKLDQVVQICSREWLSESQRGLQFELET
jgi:hypothetical protein